MDLELSAEEACFLREQLARHIVNLDNELVRTDQHALQHALARDVERLRHLERRLARLCEAAGAAA